MDVLFWVCGGGLIAYVLVQISFVTAYVLKTVRHRIDRLPDDRLPATTVIVGLRGVDPFLLESLKRLMTQDYPDYTIRIVIDSEDDPAGSVVQQAIEETHAENVAVEVYIDDPMHGLVSSTNSKTVQVLRSLDDSVEVVALMDGDAMPYPGWLRELVSPLVLDEQVGATYGNRWFIPDRGDWGSMCRYLWNVSSVPPMGLMQYAWGGCYAIRMSVVREKNLVDEWVHQMALDASSAKSLNDAGYRLKFLPQMMMFNREECPLGFCVNFIRRQYTWTWLYHPEAKKAVLKPIILAVFHLGTISYGLIEQFRGHGANATLAGAILGLHWLSSILCTFVMEWVVRRSVRSHTPSVRWLSLDKLMKIVLSVPLTLYLQAIAGLQVLTARRVSWRGLMMEIRGPGEIRILHRKSVEDRSQTTDATSY